MTVRLSIAAVAFVACNWSSFAGERQANPTLSPTLPPSDVQAAEVEGAAFPRGSPADVQIGFDAPAEVGTPDRRCVDVGNSRAALSGDFTAGPFGSLLGGGFRTSWHEGHTKVWWAPRHLADARPRDVGENGLLVRSRRLDVPSEAALYRYGGIVRSMNGVGFFNSGFWLPSSGRWMVVATFGANWGCFVVDLR